jgi:hypothetical protein
MIGDVNSIIMFNFAALFGWQANTVEMKTSAMLRLSQIQTRSQGVVGRVVQPLSDFELMGGAPSPRLGCGTRRLNPSPMTALLA